MKTQIKIFNFYLPKCKPAAGGVESERLPIICYTTRLPCQLSSGDNPRQVPHTNTTGHCDVQSTYQRCGRQDSYQTTLVVDVEHEIRYLVIFHCLVFLKVWYTPKRHCATAKMRDNFP